MSVVIPNLKTKNTNAEDSIPISDEYKIEKVPIGLLSNSIFTPDLPFRVTQPTIGCFLAEKKSIAENSYGVHKSEYSGTGETNRVLGEHENAVSRQTNHLKTAIHCAPEPPMEEKILARRVSENKAFYAGPINVAACNVYQLSRFAASKPLPKPCVKQLFPRSVVYEIEYVKEQYRKAMTEALEKERKEFEKLIRERKARKERQQNVQNLPESTEPVEIEDIQPEKTIETREESMVTNEFKEKGFQEETFLRERAETNREKTQSSLTTVCGRCGCVLIQSSCHTCKKAENLQDSEIKGLDKVESKKMEKGFLSGGPSWANLRQAEMMRVGYPFKTEAAFLHYQSVPPFDASLSYRPSKRKFPEKRFSSVNI